MIEYRTASGGAEANGNAVTGLVTPFGVETTIGDLKRGGFREQIAPGAFTKTLQERDIVFLWNHNTDFPLARTSVPEGEGSLRLHEASEGLRADAIPVQTSVGKDLLTLTRSKVVKGMSFGFEVIKDSWTDDEGRASDSQMGTRRTIHEVRLHEVTATPFPAYETTKLAARDAINAARGVEEARAESSEDAQGEERADTGAKMVDPDHIQCIASIDATLDEALKQFASCDRDSLPPEANQAIDLLHSASEQLDAFMKKAGIPDPDESDNKSEYDGAGSATPDDDARSDAQITAAIEKALYRI